MVEGGVVTVKKTKNKNYFKRTRALLLEKRRAYDTSFIVTERENLGNIINLLVEVETYLQHLPFLDAVGQERLRVYYTNSFDVKETCYELGLTRDTFDKFISRANGKIKEKLGERLFSYIEMDTYNEALIDFKLSTRNFKTAELLSMDFINALPDTKPLDSYKLTDCLEELQLFRLYSYHAMLNNINKVDSDKLSYILSLLSKGTEALRYEAEFLTTYLQGGLKNQETGAEVSFSEFVKEMQIRGI